MEEERLTVTLPKLEYKTCHEMVPSSVRKETDNTNLNVYTNTL